MKHSLTDDERTVLTIAAERMCMIPIGRWQAAVLALAARGLMRRLDSFNYVITEAGRVALAEADAAENVALRTQLEMP